ncbi:DDE Tnp4 domain-containing protein [Caerostris darwini]|uniref:DDE Tnp4 domain-containing protein n=1 Tax=Caerostris darwini TaxID=1538125 RepID=A0AAV4Q7W4_9ARAC|nr:DDE Tnp4 domain-containing protein [Caerostris darwini]
MFDLVDSWPVVSLPYTFRIGRSTVSRIIRETCEDLRDKLYPIVLAKPSSEKWLAITNNIILLACVDADYKFVLVDIGLEGHNSDGGVYRHRVIEYNKINIPSGAALPSTKKVMPFVFVSDVAFPLKNYLMQPFLKKGAFLTTVYQELGGA